MSLLMDALKKAEEAKRQSEAAAKTEPQEAEAGVNERGLPNLPSRLELLDHEFQAPSAAKTEPAAAAAPERPAEPSAEALRRERAAAQNVFAAKQPVQNRNFLIVIGLATLIAVAGIGGYFWWQLQPKGGLAPSPATARTAQTPAPLAAAPVSPPLPAAAEPPAAAPAPASTPTEGEVKPAAVPPRLTFTERRPAAKPVPAATSTPEPASPIQITKARLKVNPLIASAYQAFQSGDLAAAERDYRQALRNDTKNTDALHGLAAISLSRGQAEDAENFLFRILEADPKDSAAQAGLIALRGQADPLQSESRLKNLLAGQPESPTLNFALGNLYAREGRWNDAQQAYFRAYTADSENPDYQFNLAVSLEQLRQPRLALQYYQGALAAAAQRPAAFDKNQVAGRVSELKK